MNRKIGKFKELEAFFVPEEAMNQHILLTGKTGSGKSTQAHRMCVALAKEGIPVIAIEMHDTMASSEVHSSLKEEFEELSNIIDVYHEGIKCPLFTPVRFSDGERAGEIDTISIIAGVFSKAYNLQCRQKSMLSKAIKTVYLNNAYKTDGCKAIGEQLQCTSSEVADNVYNKMMLILEHNVFQDGDLQIIPGKINIFRLGKFDLETQVVIAEVLLSYLWTMAAVSTFKDGPIYIFLDECQNLKMGKDHALTKIMTEGRKFGVHLMLSTQFVTNSSAEAQRLLQAGLIMYFKPAQNKIRETAAVIDSTRVDEWVAVLSSLKRGEFVAVGPVEVNGKVSKTPLKINGWLD